jgi:exopolysaccharide biosynthesis WecB/TagA/CpsF family protein
MTTSSFVVEGVAVNCDTLAATAASISSDCNAPESFGVFTLNLDHVVKLRRNAAFRAAYEKARYVTADGFPIVWAGRLSGRAFKRVTGADLIEPLCAEAARARQPIYMFGSQSDALSGAALQLTAAFPSLVIAGARAPEFDFDPISEGAAAYVREIAASGAKICFVALGAPKQEMFSAFAIERTTGIAFVCIGAGLDFIAGVQTRAPQWTQAIGAEWLWRLLGNPERLARRYLRCLSVLPSVLMSSLVGQRGPSKASPS